MSARSGLFVVLALCTAGALAQTTPRFDGERKREPAVQPTAPQRQLLPPYRLELSPPAGADENAPILARPLPSTAIGLAVGERSCTLSVRPESGAGASWQGTSDATCARQETLQLPLGRYRVRLAMRWTPSGETTARDDTQDLVYEVRAGDRLRVRSLRLEPQRPEARSPLKLAWEVENVGPHPVQPLVIEVLRDGQLVERRTRSSLAPGQSINDGFIVTPTQAQRITLAINADPDNRSGEPAAHHGNNRATVSAEVAPGPPPTPVIVLGELQDSPGRSGYRPTSWSRSVTLCNVDPDARYVSELRGPRCAPSPLPCTGLYSGTPSRGEFWAGAFNANGSAMRPSCPGGLELPAGLQPGTLQGPIGSQNEHRFELQVFAEKNGRRSATASAAFSVQPNCRPPCVPLDR
jgi:CARDB